MVYQQNIQLPARQRGIYELTDQVRQCLQQSGIKTGTTHVFILHTSASLLLCENADPGVRTDLETFFAKLVPDGAPYFEHDMEGPDDMPAHVRSVLTGSSLTLPVTNGKLNLGTWQGIYLYEHRLRQHSREIVITINGDK